MKISLGYRNKFLCQNEPILNFPQEDPGQGQGHNGHGGPIWPLIDGPDPDPVQPLLQTA